MKVYTHGYFTIDPLYYIESVGFLTSVAQFTQIPFRISNLVTKRGPKKKLFKIDGQPDLNRHSLEKQNCIIKTKIPLYFFFRLTICKMVQTVRLIR